MLIETNAQGLEDLGGLINLLHKRKLVFHMKQYGEEEKLMWRILCREGIDVLGERKRSSLIEELKEIEAVERIYFLKIPLRHLKGPLDSSLLNLVFSRKQASVLQ